MGEHDFCRILYNEVMKEVKPMTTAEGRKGAWGYVYTGADHGEFQITTGPLAPFYWSGSCCCKWSAKSSGWSAWIEQQKTKEGNA